MTTPNIEDLRKLAEAYGDRCADVREYLGANAGMDEADGAWIAMKQASQTLMDALQSQAERICSMQQNMENIYAENKTLRAQLAALQVDDELPELQPYLAWRADNNKSPKPISTLGAWVEDYARQAQSMVRAKMVPLEKDAARYRQLREQIYIDKDKRLRITRTYLIADQGKTFQEQLDAAIDAAMCITREPK